MPKRERFLCARSDPCDDGAEFFAEREIVLREEISACGMVQVQHADRRARVLQRYAQRRRDVETLARNLEQLRVRATAHHERTSLRPHAAGDALAESQLHLRPEFGFEPDRSTHAQSFGVGLAEQQRTAGRAGHCDRDFEEPREERTGRGGELDRRGDLFERDQQLALRVGLRSWRFPARSRLVRREHFDTARDERSEVTAKGRRDARIDDRLETHVVPQHAGIVGEEALE